MTRNRVESAGTCWSGSEEPLGEPDCQTVRSALADLEAVSRHGHNAQAAPALRGEVRHRRVRRKLEGMPAVVDDVHDAALVVEAHVYLEPVGSHRVLNDVSAPLAECEEQL